MQAEIQQAIDSAKLTPALAGALSRLTPGTYVSHKSWGFGQIAALDFLVYQMTIDFRGKKGHAMQLQYAAESLAVVPAEHILAQKASNLSTIKSEAKNDPARLARTVLTSFGGKATQDQIASVLVPDVLSEAEFKKWIESAKKAMKNDGHFAIPNKKGLAFELREGPISHADEYLAAFNNARQVRHQIEALDLIVKHGAEFLAAPEQLQPVIAAVNDTARKSAKLQPGKALSLLLTRDELIEKVPGSASAFADPTVGSVLLDEQKNLTVLLNEIPAAKMRRVLAEIPAAFGEAWPAKAVSLVLRGKLRVVAEAARLLSENGRLEDLRAALSRAISEHSITTDALIWLCNERDGALADLANIGLLISACAALERDQFNEKKDRKLHDLLLNDQELVPDLIANASLEQLRDTMRRLLVTPVFEEINKRSLIGRIIRVYPDLQNMVTGDSGAKDEAIIVSWESLERKKADLDELVAKKIPDNVKEIAIARDYGDLRENAEFKAAKEMQRVLGRRRAEMERDLGLARGTDFANVDTNVAGIGTVITVREIPDGQIDVFTILGAWDTVPESGIISYKSALAVALNGKKVGEQINAPTEHGERTVEIVKIEAYRKAATA
jgi:transcription elongation GreA/GreB family factor